VDEAHVPERRPEGSAPVEAKALPGVRAGEDREAVLVCVAVFRGVPNLLPRAAGFAIAMAAVGFVLAYA